MLVPVPQPAVHPGIGRCAVLAWACLWLAVAAPVALWAGEGDIAETPPAVLAEAPADAPAPDWASLTEIELQEHLQQIRADFLQVRRDLYQLQVQIEEEGRSGGLADSMMRLSEEIRHLEEQAEQNPEQAGDLELQTREVRRQLHALEAERLGRLDQSEAYRTHRARQDELREQLMSVLQALENLPPETDEADGTDEEAGDAPEEFGRD